MTPALPPAALPPSSTPLPSSASADPGNTSDAAAATGFNTVLQEKMAAPAKGKAETDKIAAPATAPAAESAVVTDPPVASDAAAALMPQLAALLGVIEGSSPAAPASGADTRMDASLQAARATTDTPPLSLASLPTDNGKTLEQGAAQPSTTASGADLTAADTPARSAPAASGGAANVIQATASKDPASQTLLSLAENAPTQTQAQTQPHAPGNPVIPPSSSGSVHAGDTLPSQHISTPLGAPGWSHEVGQKIVLLAARNDSRAELTLTPPHLGKVEIALSINGDQTSATFVSASQAARDALEQALPRLREMLADAGIFLGQASVNAHASGQDTQDFSSGQHEGTGHDQAGPAGTPAASRTQWLQRSEGLVDTFA